MQILELPLHNASDKYVYRRRYNQVKITDKPQPNPQHCYDRKFHPPLEFDGLKWSHSKLEKKKKNIADADYQSYTNLVQI
jgi:hypothetical protein